MVNQQLVDHIKQQLEQGVSEGEIRNSLIANHWQTQDIDEAFYSVSNLVSGQSSLPPPPPPVSSATVVATTPLQPQGSGGAAPKGFNWGAFWLTWLWGIAHGIWITLLLIPLAIITTLISLTASVATLFAGLVNAIFGSTTTTAYSWLIFGAVILINLLVSIWFGLKGNVWSWARRGTRDSKQFQQREKAWKIAGWIVGALVILSWIPFVLNLASGKFSKSSVECASGVSFKVNGVEKCPQSQKTSEPSKSAELPKSAQSTSQNALIPSFSAPLAEIANKLNPCEKYKTTFTPIFDENNIEILGIREGKCGYVHEIKGGEKMECEFSESERIAVAQLFKDLANAKDKEIIDSMIKIDGNEVDNPLQKAVNSGACVVKG